MEIQKLKKVYVEYDNISYLTHDIRVGTPNQVITREATHTIDDWAAAVQSDFKVMFLDGDHVPANDVEITITETNVRIEMQSRLAIINTDTFTFNSTGDRCSLSLNLTTTENLIFTGVEIEGGIAGIIIPRIPQGYEIVVGTTDEVDHGLATHDINTWAAAVLDNDRIIFLDGAHSAANTAEITIDENKITIQMQSATAIIDTDTYIFNSTGTECDININVTDYENVNLITLDTIGRINNKVIELRKPLGYDIVVGTDHEVTIGEATHDINNWAAAVSTDNRVIFLDGAHSSASTAEITIDETGVIVHMQSKAAIINTDTYTFTSSGGDCDIELNITTVSNNVISGTKTTAKVNGGLFIYNSLTHLAGHTIFGDATTDTITLNGHFVSDINTTANALRFGHDNVSFTDANSTVYFASDATLFWDESAGILTWDRDSSFTGHMTLGSDNSDIITFNGDTVGHITPNVSNVDDIGSTTQEYRSIYSNNFYAGLDQQMRMYGTGDDGYIDIDDATYNGDLYIRSRTAVSTFENMIVAKGGAEVSLYYNDVAKLATTATGVYLSDTLTVTNDTYLNANSYIGNAATDTISLTGHVITDINMSTHNIRLGHNGASFTNADSTIYFASDATILWDESEDEFIVSKNTSFNEKNITDVGIIYLDAIYGDGNAIAIGDGSDTIVINPTTFVSFSQKDIEDVGNISLVSISSEGDTITIGVGGDPGIILTDGTKIAMSLGNVSGDNFIIDTTAFVVEGDTGNVAIGAAAASGYKLYVNGTTHIIGNFTCVGTGMSSFATDLTIGNDLIVDGDFTVNGTTTTIDTTNLDVTDKNISMNVGGTTDASASGGGITLIGLTPKTILWDDDQDNWSFNQDVNITTGQVYRINNDTVLNYNTLGGNIWYSSLRSTGNLNSGTITSGFGTINTGSSNISTTGTITSGNLALLTNTLSSTTGDINITPLAGNQIVLDGTIVIDAGVVTGATSITSTAFVGTIQTAAQATINHNSLSNYTADRHVLHGGVTITAGNGLTGGGNISSNLTLTIGTPGTLTNDSDNAVTATSHTHGITDYAVSGTANEITVTGAGRVLGAAMTISLPAIINANTTGTASAWTTGRTISLTGNVTGVSGAWTGSGNVSFSATIANDAVTYAKMQNMTGPVFMGRQTASSGNVSSLSTATARSMLNIANGAQVNVATNLSIQAGTGGRILYSSTGGDVTIPEATGSTSGFMSTTHHNKLDGITASANNYSHPTTNGNRHIPVNGSANQFLRYSSAGVAAWASTFTGNISGSAATVTSPAQPAITSVGTTAALKLPTGTTAQRPTPINGMIRMNTTLFIPEFFSVSSGLWVPMLSTFQPTPTIGDMMGGGIFAGYISVTGNRTASHYLIVSPKATGEDTLVLESSQTPYNSSVIDGPANTVLLASIGSPAADFVMGLSIGGNTDWYIPALFELAILYYFLKPFTLNNSTTDGANDYAVDPQSSSNYTTSVPGQTSVAVFRVGNSEAFVNTLHWSSTSVGGSAYVVSFQDGTEYGGWSKNQSKPIRAVRRIPIYGNNRSATEWDGATKTVSSSSPTGGNDGDMWFKYTP